MSDVGTLAWARRTGGRMSASDKLDQVRAAVVEQLGMLPKPWRRRLPVDPSVTLPAGPPATEVARAAYERAEELSSPALLGHCLRTWLFGELAAAVDSLEHDEELFYVAAMFHDLGLTEAHTGADPRAHCFAVEGAFAAEHFLSGLPWPAERTERVTAAIAAHLNLRVPPEEHGVEAHLVNVGAGTDVVGRGLGRLPAAAVDEVLARHPRGSISVELVDVLKAQAAARPGSRVALAWRLGFRRYIEQNPLNTRESAPVATTGVSRTS